ncbi:MAG: hypothetical protein M1833_007088 [Piccolia ochrophora]|nr:MAG: hypothetical protein M1833_007088 [Piccolia ochrophora]
MSDSERHERDGTNQPSPSGRPRAPTITIDTSAVSPSQDTDGFVLQTYPNATPQLQGDQSATERHEEPSTDQQNAQVNDEVNDSPKELKKSASFESRQSRPTSPHNVSSPTSRGKDHNFLSVPGARSRGNSVDTEDDSHSPTSFGGETFLPTPAASAQGDGSNQPARGANLDDPSAIINDEEALKPDPGTEADFEVEGNKFAFSPGQLTKMINPKSLSAFYALGGLQGIEKGLRTNRQAGLSADETFLHGTISFQEATNVTVNEIQDADGEVPKDVEEGRGIARANTSATTGTFRKKQTDSYADRKRIFRDNRLPEKRAKNIFELAWIAYNDKVLILLTIAAAVSLALGLYQTFGQKHDPNAPAVEWVEGVAIIVAIVIVVVVGAANDWQKERQFVKLNKKKEDRYVKVVRSGKSQEISIFELLAGDVMHLEPGDLIPVDGVFIEGHSVKCDESSATGESDLIKKHAAGDVFKAIEAHEDVRKLDPFILSGGKVTEGVGTFLVTAVGVHSAHGKTMMSLREETEATPLQRKLNKLAEQIAKLGGAAALLLFVVLLIKFLVQVPNSPLPPSEKGQNFLRIFIVAVTIVVVAVPEGLPLAVTLALAFATTRMLKDNNLVRVLRACETMGNATTVCSDKTGTLTQNKMSVVAGTVGTASRFGDNKAISNDSPERPPKGKTNANEDESVENVTAGECIKTLSSDVIEVLEQSIVLNSTAFEGEENGQQTFIGSKTETALLTFSREHLGMGPVSVERSNANIVQFIPFDSGRKCMASIVKLDDGSVRMYVKGASEIMLNKCSKILRDPTHDLATTPLTTENTETISQIITTYASRSLRTLSLVYRDFEEWPPKGARRVEDDAQQADFDDIFKDMVFLGLVGIQDPLRVGVREAVLTCQHAGVFVRMVTGDNILTARAIAEECGIYTAGGIVMEGPTFRKLSGTQMDQVIPRLQVLARSSPEDKRKLVKRLKEMGETVAVTGDGTNDAPALKAGDVGFSMGIAGTEVAKEASAIILMDDNFASIVKAIMWGRAVNDAVRKFLQFQLTVNVTAVVLTFVSAVASASETSVLTAVQLLWVNLIMDTFAALALATDPPVRSVLDRKPDPKSAPLITVRMWKMIIGQAIYQLVVTFILHFGGRHILSYSTDLEIRQLRTLVFNTFVWMQIFNQINNRRLDNKFNIFEGITHNYFFVAINCVMIGGQVMIIYIGGAAFTAERLNGAQWGYSIILGALSLPIGVIIRLVPDSLVAKFIPERFQRRKTPELVVSDDEQRFEWNPALEEIREELTFLKRVRGGRLNGLAFKLQHPRETLLPRTGSRSSSISQTPAGENASDFGSPQPATPENRSRRRGRSRSNSAFGPAAAMAGIVAGSIAGWSPIDRGHEGGDQQAFSQARGRSSLQNESGIEIHPDTKPSDPVITNPAETATAPSQVPQMTPAFAGQANSQATESDQQGDLDQPKEPQKDAKE